MAIATAFHVSNNGVDSDYRNASNRPVAVFPQRGLITSHAILIASTALLLHRLTHAISNLDMRL